MPPEQNMSGVQVEPKGNGALVGAIIIILILIVGGVYLWKKSAEAPTIPTNELGSNDSANTAELEGELNTMDLDNLDQDI